MVKSGLRERYKAKGWSDVAIEAEIERKMKEEYKYFIRRVRRVIPSPAQLHREFVEQVQLFCDVKDNKTGFKFFTKAGWKIFRSTEKHILKGCLSDAPGLAKTR